MCRDVPSMQFDTIDYSIYAARNYGLRLLIPLTGQSPLLAISANFVLTAHFPLCVR